MRHIIITGAAGGIGFEVVKVLSAPDNILYCIDSNKLALDRLPNELPGKIIRIHSSISSVKECRRIINVMDGKVSGLVHLAGILENDLAWGSDEELWGRVIDSNLKSAYDITGEILNNIDESQQINIVYMSSVAYRRGAYENVAYSVAKSGLVGLTRSVAKRVGIRGVVNAVAPSVILTSMPAEYLTRHQERLLSQIPMKRFGKPIEVAMLVKFLMSTDCTYVTGQVINIDGGSVNS